MEGQEVDTNSLKPVTSPERSLSRALRQRRKKGEDDTSSLSVHSGDNERGSLLRKSVDAGSRRLSRVTDKLERSNNGTSSDDGRPSSHDSSHTGRRLSKFLRRRKKDRNEEEASPAQGLDLTHANTVDGSDLVDLNNASSESISRSKSIDSSLLTDDSDPEPNSRPTLTSRTTESHTGYLTLSSPLIAAETVDPNQSSPPPPPDGPPDPEPLRHPPTEPVSRTTRSTSPLKYSELPPEDDRAPSNASNWTSLFAGAKEQGTTSPALSSPSALDAAKAAHKLSLKTQSSTSVPSTIITPATPTVDSEPRLPTTLRNRSTSKSNTLPTLPHRRVKSAAAASSRLSTGGTSILTPAIEEVSTPGGSLIQPNNSSFFSSVFSATQNAGNQITNFFANPNNPSNRGRSSSGPAQEKTGSAGGEEVILSDSQVAKAAEDAKVALQEPAVATLGSGSLTLGHLGISDASSDAEMPSKEDYSEDLITSPTHVQDNSTANKTEEAAAAEAVAAAYTDKVPVTKTTSGGGDTLSFTGRPASVGSGGVAEAGAATPPQSLASGKEGSLIHRNNSVRSRLSDRTRGKRHRHGSGATGSGSTIAAALGSTHAALAAPSKSPRPTGFAVANQKRNKDFHTLFKSVPEDDYLIEDYSAALQREILLHGRLYVSERNVCFSSNIMGYITTLVISFDEVMAMEKRNTAMIFPNAIVIQTLHAKNTFASLINRDGTYDLLYGMWKIKHPNLKETETGHKLDNTAIPAKVEEAAESDDASEEDSEVESGEEDDEVASYIDPDGTSMVGSDGGEVSKVTTNRLVSTTTGAVPPLVIGTASKSGSPDAGGPSAPSGDFPGPAAHAPTECTDADTHFEKPVLDDMVPAPLGKVYSMMFGPASGVCMKKFLEEQDSGDIQIEDDKKGMGESSRTFSYSYIKKLNGSIGPKQTKCLVSQTMDTFDLEKAVSVTCSTQTPDVPSGNVFVTKTRYCLMWGPGNGTRMLMSSGVEWSGKSWIKGPIEKGCEAGQAQHGKDLVTFLKSQLTTRSPVKGGKVKSKGKRKKTIESLDATDSGNKATATSKSSQPSDWGPLEPLHAILSPVADILGPLANVTVVLSFLLFVVTILWLRQSYSSSTPAAQATLMTPHRLAAYEEMWRKEESELWHWLEDRLKLDELYTAGHSPSSSTAQQVLHDRNLETKMQDQGMSDRQVDDAIRVTEEKLASLKGVVDQRRIKA